MFKEEPQELDKQPSNSMCVGKRCINPLVLHTLANSIQWSQVPPDAIITTYKNTKHNCSLRGPGYWFDKFYTNSLVTNGSMPMHVRRQLRLATYRSAKYVQPKRGCGEFRSEK